MSQADCIKQRGNSVSETPPLFFLEVPMPRKNSQVEADLQRALSTLCEIVCAVDENTDSQMLGSSAMKIRSKLLC